MNRAGPIAVISDIHGNVDALKAVLADIDRQGITNIVNLGDHVSAPLAPRETADLLMSRRITSVLGNHDRWIVGRPRDKLGAWDGPAADQLQQQHLAWLRSLPATIMLDDGIFLCHATPGDDLTYWLETVWPDGKLTARPVDEISDLLGNVSAEVVLCGHTHVARAQRIPGGPLIVNPGSVGVQAFDDDEPVHHVVEAGTPDARYAVIKNGPEGWSVTFHLVPYDASRMVALAKGFGHDWSDVLLTGRVASR